MQNDITNKRSQGPGRGRHSAPQRKAIRKNNGMGRPKMTSVRGFRHNGEQDREPYCYTESGLDDVYLLSGYEKEQTAYGEGVSIKDVDELHKAIGCALATQKKFLSGKELRFLRKEMDLTQVEIGQLVGLSDQQVARWEKDKYEIPSAADYVIRFFYLEHIKKQVNLRGLIEKLKNMDTQDLEGRFVFEDTKQGWRRRKTA